MLDSAPPADPVSPAPPRWSLSELLYAVALIGAATATFGWVGLTWILLAIAAWLISHAGHRPVWTLLSEAAVIAFVLGVLGVLFLPAARSGSPTNHCQNNLKQLGLALNTYHSVYSQFPPHHYEDASGKPIHSWRAMTANFLESNSPFVGYRYSEPWDGPNNSGLHTLMFACHYCPARENGMPFHSHYLAVVGDNAAFSSARGRKTEEFDDPSRTILILEHGSRDQHWMAPGDLTFDEALALLTAESTLAGDHGGHPTEGFFFVALAGRHAAMADGSVRFLPSGLPEDVARRLLQVHKDRPLTDEEIPSATARYGPPNWGNWLRMGIFLALALVPAIWGWLRLASSSVT